MELIRKIIQELLGIADKDMPEGDDLSGFSAEQINEARELAQVSFSEAVDAKDIDSATSYTEALEAFSAETTKREEAAAQIDSTLAELAQRAEAATSSTDAEGEDEEEGEGGGEGEGEDEGGEDEEAPPVETVTPPVTETVTPPVVEAPAAPAAEVATPEPVAVAAAVATPTTIIRAVPKPSTTPKPRPKFAIVAAGDISGHSAGAKLSTSDVAEPFVAKMEAATQGRIGSKMHVGKVELEYPSDRRLSSDDSAHINDRKVKALSEMAQELGRKQIAAILQTPLTDAVKLTTLTAEGGLCAPVNVRYDIYGIGTDRRPIRDGLMRFGATRGGIQFNEPPVLGDVAGAANVYTEAQDAAGTSYPKGCIRVDCGDLITVKVSAISLCMEVGNFQRLSFPENFAEWWRLGQVAHARLAEETLWTRMKALATGNRGIHTSASLDGLGATRTVLAAIARSTQQYRDRFRVGDDMVLRVFIPSWVVTMMQEDLTNQAPGDSAVALAKATITRYFAAFNVLTSFTLDGQPSSDTGSYAQADGALNGWPNFVDLIIVPEGALLHLDMGNLNFGTEIRDFDQIRNNDSGAFMETFENVAHVGPQVEWLTINNLCPSGISVAPDDVDICGSGY